jgi:hypothetical protein
MISAPFPCLWMEGNANVLLQEFSIRKLAIDRLLHGD